MKTKIFSFLRFNRFDKFGEQIVSQFVVFECKWLFSIIFFYFHKCSSHQDRFHTHAFNAISIRLWGSYDEHVIKDETTICHEVHPRNTIFKYFPRNRYHRIANSSGCCTLLLSGPWKRFWKEYYPTDRTVKFFTWGRDNAEIETGCTRYPVADLTLQSTDDNNNVTSSWKNASVLSYIDVNGKIHYMQ